MIFILKKSRYNHFTAKNVVTNTDTLIVVEKRG